MEENNIQNYVPEEEGIDILDIVRKMWNGRKTIIICTCIFIVLGLVAALTMKRTYSVSTLMVPQMNAKGSSSLSSLAGFDIGTGESSGDLSPLTYPEILTSVPFRLKLLYTPLHYEKVDTAVSMFTYAKEYSKPSVMSKVKKYTIGLPFTILGALRGEKEDVVLPAGGDDASPKPLVLTEDEVKYLELIARSVSLSVDKKEGLVTLSVTGSEPLQTAELAIRAQNLLQEEVTRFRTEKAIQELEYIQARYDETMREAEMYQTQLAAIRDRSQDMVGSRGSIQRERVQQKYTVANSIYSEMAKQLEQAKMQVKKDTPVLTVIQPVTVPSKPSNSRAKTLVMWVFLGVVLGCGIVLAREYLPELKKQLLGSGSEADA